MKVKYIIDYKKYTYIDCETEEEIKVVEDLNKDMEAFIKSEQRYNDHTISMDHISNNDGDDETVELPDNSTKDSISILINKERISAIMTALDLLTPKQKDIFLKVVVEGLSTAVIAKNMSLNQKTVYDQYKTALKKIKEFTKDLR